jgi:GT2 family glycosyltransferase
MNPVLVICTKDRPLELAELFCNLSEVKAPLMRILVVDSTENSHSKLQVEKLCTESNLPIELLFTSAGLPHQRNCAVSWLLEYLPSADIVFFLDDDARVHDRYFEAALEYVAANQNWIALTGTPEKESNREVKTLRRLFLLDSKLSGRILKSGETTLPDPKTSFETVQWLPGISMVINMEVLRKLKFDGSLRMYYEDVEMSLRIRNIGELVALRDMRYSHHVAISGRESTIDQVSYTLGIRWELSGKNQNSISKIGISWSILGSFCYSVISILFLRNFKESKFRIIGILTFIKRLILKKEIVQRIKS